MKKMILALVVCLLAAPAFSAVKITAEKQGDKIAIKYDSTAETELVRAFALDVKITGGSGVIVDVCDFKVGDDNNGYGIFPANFSRYITVDAQTGDVANWAVAGYTPVADVNDPGAAGALGSANITIEMGSLYETNAPAKTGTLCTLKCTGTGQLCVTTNALRGGVVLENAAEATTDLTQACVTLGVADCFPSTYTTYNDWVTMGKPDCWCSKATKGSGYQCDGDADGKDSGGLTKYRVFTGDLALLVANWQKKINDATLNPCADIDHKDSGGLTKYRVFTKDLSALVTNWQKKDAQLPGDCPRAE